jgi:O-antigen chain-terminating methyltransferase
MESEHVELTKTVAALREENFALSARLRQRPQPVAMTAAPGVEPPPALATDLIDYVLFEYRFRGSREAIAEHFQRFVGFFGRGGRVLDIGCGRGEMVELLCARGCDVLGIDLDEGMVADCVERGLPVTQADAIIHLGSCENASLDGVFCSQVIEHLTTTRWAELMDVARRKLRPNGCLVIETVNPGSFYALAHAFYKDLTHVRPIHPEALQFVARSQGWRDTKLLMLSPHPLLEGSEGRDPAVNALVDTVFGHMDYALVAYR